MLGSQCAALKVHGTVLVHYQPARAIKTATIVVTAAGILVTAVYLVSMIFLSQEK